MINYDLIFSKFPIIETDRLLLRAFTGNELNDYYNMCFAVDYRNEFLEDGMFVSKSDAYNNIMSTYPKSFNDKRDLSFAIELKDSKRLIGLRDVFIDSPYESVLTQGYIIEEYRNNGYNQEVLNALIILLRNANVESLIFNCSTTNLSVIHIANKLGFLDISNYQMKSKHGRQKFIMELNE